MEDRPDQRRTDARSRGLVKMLLLKRMESSAQALVNTLNTMLRAYRVFFAALESGAVLVGRRMDQLLRGLDPAGDLRASPEYKKHLARVLTKRAIQQAEEGK